MPGDADETRGRTPDPVLLSDARIARIRVADSGEDLIRVRPCRCLSVAETVPIPPADGVTRATTRVHDLLRREVARRLEQAAAALPDGVRLHLVEGYRPQELQVALYEAHRRRLLRDLPEIDVPESHRLASRFVAPPSVAAHPSGAAVDVTLVDAAGRLMDMGTAIDATPEESDGACYLDAPGIGVRARANRRLLATSLRAAGLVNYPTEWWHWSYGDRYWAFVTGVPAARYGAVRAGIAEIVGIAETEGIAGFRASDGAAARTGPRARDDGSAPRAPRNDGRRLGSFEGESHDQWCSRHPVHSGR